jgi:Histidine kinase
MILAPASARLHNRAVEALAPKTAVATGLAKPPRGFWIAYGVAFVLLTCLYAGVFASTGAASALAMRAATAAMLPSALAGLAAMRLARWWPWRGERRAGFVAKHLLGLMVLTALSTAAWLFLISCDAWLEGGSFAPRGGRMVVIWQALIDGLLLLAAIGIGHAWYAVARAAHADALRARAELALLRSQLNPHFVLNTLHALLGLVRREPAKAEAALERLGELLRFGLRVHQGDVDQVAFREEWAFVTSYLGLEQLRLGTRLRLTLSAGDDVMELPIPPFALQPLVENAIIHGIAPRRDGGSLEVKAQHLGSRLRVEVDDDGPGASDAEMAASPRLGLRLLRERLAALYAGNARLAFEPRPQGGLHVLLDLPDAGCGEAA